MRGHLRTNENAASTSALRILMYWCLIWVVCESPVREQMQRRRHWLGDEELPYKKHRSRISKLPSFNFSQNCSDYFFSLGCHFHGTGESVAWTFTDHGAQWPESSLKKSFLTFHPTCLAHRCSNKHPKQTYILFRILKSLVWVTIPATRRIATRTTTSRILSRWVHIPISSTIRTD